MMKISSKTWTAPNRGWNLVRVALAGLLLTASALKCWQLATEPIIGTSLLDSRWLLMATVEFEIFFGLCLLANVWAKPTWAAALACFGLFTCVSLCKALSGHASCGCFGRIVVSPWYTGALDLAVMALLLRWRPKESFFTIQRAVAVLLIWLLIGLPAAYAMGSYTPATVSDTGHILGNEKVVVLEPEKWIGKQFPLLPYIEDVSGMSRSGQQPLRKRLAQGHWIVVLYHHDCPKCQERMPKYNELANRAAIDSTVPQVAMVEVPPYGGTNALPVLLAGKCSLGRLSKEKRWFVETPLELLLRSALVIPTTDEECGTVSVK